MLCFTGYKRINKKTILKTMDRKKLLEEFIEFVNGRHFNEFRVSKDEVEIFLDDKGINEDFLCDKECSGETKCGEQCQTCWNMEKYD